jgi:hypothetical protein
MWRTWNDEEQQLLKEVGKKGIKRALQSPQAASIDPELKKLLWSGLVHVTVHRCKGLHVSGLLMRPSVYVLSRCHTTVW